MSEAKTTFAGDNVEAYLVHPPKDRYINFCGRVLHWYASMDRPLGVLPDFRMKGAIRTNPEAVGI